MGCTLERRYPEVSQSASNTKCDLESTYLGLEPLKKSRLLQVRMRFNLIHSGLDLGTAPVSSSSCDQGGILRLQEVLNLLPGEVADTDSADFTLLHQGLHCLPGLRGRYVDDMDGLCLWVDRETSLVILGLLECDRPMDEVQIHVVGSQVSERLIQSRFNIGGLVVRIPELRRDENVGSRNARCTNASSDFSLVVINCGSINVTIPGLQSRLDRDGDLVWTGLLLPLSASSNC